MPHMLTITSTLAAIRALDLCAVYRTEFGEFRICYPKDKGDSAKGYYTADRTDALETALHMARAEAISTDIDSPCATE